ncbi:FMN-binding protein [Acinetobacter pollinis]|uniref:FMN-binding protein n=1 Tax=Acinetobacter pollinis TaxID=2605270 RepID=UPI0018A312F5|nr:FMN-binding protein [Acinetobacter pollinis]MBF7689614.1 FMN-binding protein [Acinetobacter pollinis]MBF7692668.1 FMN-binding protein [Acinetobacter pollinis]MBF7698233.1 FMN-binding protein [Acinetobacter pollinis]MBF7700642.1 FMN-binding protein [Acinetobacter pollinis]
MKWTSVVGATLFVTPLVSHATTYLTAEQVKQVIFPHQLLTQQNIQLTKDQEKKLKEVSGITSPLKTDQIFKTKEGDWLVIDQVLGKHEMITYAVGINAKGAVKQIEIMEYTETYGSQVRNASWREQFVGKTSSSAITLGKDIQNISGATLSSKHITDGVHRIMGLYAMELKSLK